MGNATTSISRARCHVLDSREFVSNSLLEPETAINGSIIWVMTNTMTHNEDVATILHAMDEQFMRNFAAKDAKQLTKDFYAEDAQLLPPHQESVVGRAAIEKTFETLIAGGLRDLILQTNKVEASGDLAYGVGIYKMTMPSAAGAEIHDEGKYVVVYRRQPADTWRAVADIFNSSLPASSAQ